MSHSNKVPGGIRSIEIGYRILLAIQQGPAPVSLKDIAERAELAPSAAHNYLKSLIRTGMAQADGRGLYRLGPALAALGMTAIRQVDSFESIRAQASALRDETGVGAAVVIWTDTGPVILFHAAGVRKTMFELRNGPISLLWTGSGNVFIAYLPREATRPVALTEIDPEHARKQECDRVLDEIADKVRARGYAVQNVKELPGFVAISAPIWNANGEVSYALTLTAPEAQIDVTHDGPHVSALLRASRAASQSLGASP